MGICQQWFWPVHLVTWYTQQYQYTAKQQQQAVSYEYASCTWASTTGYDANWTIDCRWNPDVVAWKDGQAGGESLG